MKKMFSVGVLMVIVALSSLSAISPVKASPFYFVDYHFDSGEVTGQGQTGFQTYINHYIDPNGNYFKIYAHAISILGWYTKSWIQVDVWSHEFEFTELSQYCNIEWSYTLNGILLATYELIGGSVARIETWCELKDVSVGISTTWKDLDVKVEGPNGLDAFVYEPRNFATAVNFVQGHKYRGILRARATAGGVQAYEGEATVDFFTDAGDRRIFWNSFAVWSVESCPLMYAWNGNKFAFIEDVLTPGGLAFPDVSLRYDFRPPNPHDFAVIPGEMLQAVDGTYQIELAEYANEIAYIDALRLVAVDHPIGYDLFSPTVMTQIPLPFEYRTVYNPISPIYATKCDYHYGSNGTDPVDILDAILAPDDLNYAVANVDEFHTVELDFGDLGNLADISEFKLITRGWMTFGNDPVGEVLWIQQHPETARAPYIEVINEYGGWEAVGEPICNESFWEGHGTPRTTMRDIRDWLKTSDYRFRLHYWGGFQLDWIAVDITDTPFDQTTFRILKPATANLYYTGGVEFVPMEGDVLGQHPALPDRDIPHNYDAELFVGNFTRYGNVKPLLMDSDDMFVIMKYGDSIHIEFPGVPVPKGMERDYYFFVDGYFKLPYVKYFLNNPVSTVDPLPFHSMTTYPYGEGESYPDDPVHQAYLRVWNTRYIGP